MKKSVSFLALMAGLALGIAQQAVARDIFVSGTTATWSAIQPPPTVDDTITIDNDGVLIVNQSPVVAGRINIGNATTAGTLEFDNAARTVTVTTALTFGANSGNLLNMGPVLLPAHILRVGGTFLAGGAGTFRVGLGIVEYYNANQTITARIAGTTINYKDLTLSGGGTKTLESGLTVTGNLKINQGVVLSGSVPVIYGSLASLEYVGESLGGTQTTTSLEWPESSSLSVRISALPVALAFTVKLNSDKAINGNLTIDPGTTLLSPSPVHKLDTDGKMLTVRGNISNAGEITGTGTVVLAGSSKQTLSGVGKFGNLALNNAAGAATPATGLTVGGRLSLVNGKLELYGTQSTTALLSLGGVDQAVTANTTYGSSASLAQRQNDTYFANTGANNWITLKPKPAATFDVARVDVAYGTRDTVISGKVTGGAGGNVAVVGDTVTVTVLSTPINLVRQAPVTSSDGSFAALFDTSTLPAGDLSTKFQYVGGINLGYGERTLTPGLRVTPLTITVVPRDATKFYGTADPPLAFDYSPPLIGGDQFTGSLTRELANQTATPTGGSPTGEQVGSYQIIRGTGPGALGLPSSYTLVVIPGRFLVVNPLPVNVLATGTAKTYGDADPTSLPYSFSPPTLRYNDTFTGRLGRTAGESAGDYGINQGDLAVKSENNSTLNYTVFFSPAVFRIDRRSVTIGLATGSQSKTYGQDNPARYVPEFAAPGLASTDKDDTATGLARAAGENAGNYAVNQGTLKIIDKVDSKDKTANYILTIPSSLVYIIYQRDLRITAITTSVPYGDAIPALIKYERRSLTNPNTWETWPDNGAPSTPATVGKWQLGSVSTSPPTRGSMPGAYAFVVLRTAADSNYNIAYWSGGAPITGEPPGTLTIAKRALTVRADNQSKVEDGFVFPNSSYTASANFATDAAGQPLDNFNTAFKPGGTHSFSGPAMSARVAGAYEIAISGSYTSDKYENPTYAPGSLVITKSDMLVEQSNVVTWGPGENYSWTINQANGGQAGVSPGWKLLKVKKTTGGAGGTLNITASGGGSKFKIYLSTLQPGTSAAGPAGKFDPTRAYSWKIVEAETSIIGFDAAAFQLISDGVGLFANKTFGGQFTITNPSATPKELYINFTPPAQFGAANSPTDAQVTDLLNTMLVSDVDVMYLTADKYSVTPQETVTIRLNVGNLQQNVFGAQAYLNFSSAHFVTAVGTTAEPNPGRPVVAPGGGVWDSVIFRTWNVGGDLDTVIGLSFDATTGTSDDATVAYITLTPKKTLTGKSRVVFRSDSAVITDGIGGPAQGVAGGTLLTDGNGNAVRPARVQTKDITIPADTTKPKINSIAATQPQYGDTVNVKNGPATDPASNRAVRGKVTITINASDLPGTGLSAAPLVILDRVGGGTVGPLKPVTTGSSDGNFVYEWTIDKDTQNGKWNGTVNVVDNVGNVADAGTFHITVNTRQVSGVVELDAFLGSARDVVFTTGTGSGDVQQTRTRRISTTDTTFQAAGEFADLPAFANELLAPSTAVATSAYLRYGTINSLASLVNLTLFGGNNFIAYMRDMWFGTFGDDVTLFHNGVVLPLKNGSPRQIDAYVRGRLPQSTLSLLSAWPTTLDLAKNIPTPDQIVAMETALLNDFNNIVVGPPDNIYDPLRFYSVQPPVRVNGNEVDQILDRIEDDNADNNPSKQELIRLNRLLLNGAYLTYKYGNLNALTAKGMVNYAGGSDPTLVGQILLDLDNLASVQNKTWWMEGTAQPKSLYTETRFLGVPMRKATSDLVLTIAGQATPADADVVQLNRWLLEDGLAMSVGSLNYAAGALRPITAIKLQEFVSASSANKPAKKAELEPLLVTDLNKVLTSGVLTRANFEASYPTQITKYTSRGTYTLIDLPNADSGWAASATKVAAKTSWNLRVRLTPATGSDANAVLAHFVNGGKVDANRYLKAGDINGDNAVNLGDFAIFQPLYTTTSAIADLNGDGAVNILDYSRLTVNFNSAGDPAVNQP